MVANNIEILAAEQPIKSVTVFKTHKAEIVRILPVELKAGSNKISILGLSSSIDTQSVRVSGLGSSARLSDVVCTVNDGDTAQGFSFAAKSPEMEKLEAKKARLLSEKRVYEHEADILVAYGKSLTGEHVSVGAMEGFLKTFVHSGKQNLERAAEITAKLEAVTKEIEALQKVDTSKTDKNVRGTRKGKVVVVVNVPGGDTKVDFKLTYIVSDAAWTPTYELHAKTVNGVPSSSLSLHYRARVTQSTGESWDDTALTLSTVAFDAAPKVIPRLSAVKITQQPRFAPNIFRANNAATNNIGPFAPTKSIFAQNNFAQKTMAPPMRPPQAQQQQIVQQQQPQQQVPFGAPATNINRTDQFGGAPAAASNSLFGAAAPAAPLAQQPTAFGFGARGSSNSVFGSAPAVQQPAGFGAFGGGGTLQTYAAPLPDEDDDDAFEPVSYPPAQSDGEDDVNLTVSPEAMTMVTETPLAIAYSVEGESTIPTDGVAHQVEMAVLPFEGKTWHVVVPRMDLRVYLQCEVKNTSEYRLLPGPVSIILDDSFVSKTSISDINTGDTFTCTLGDSSSAKVTYTRSCRAVKSQAGNFSEAMSTTTFTTKITIHNKHQFPITDLVVKEVIPMSDDNRVKVILRKPVGLADAKKEQVVVDSNTKCGWDTLDGQGGEKEGKFAWRSKIDAGAKISLEAEWEVKAASDLHLGEKFV